MHPEYREVLRTYAKNQGLPIEEFGYDAETGQIDLADLEAKLDKQTACVIIQSPNFFGIVENVRKAADLAHAHGALLVFTFSEAVSLGILEPPRDADIVAGELQSFAISPSYGGPFAGIIAAKEKFIRQLPGRLVGQTTDTHGNRAFCLTLATREQHIRREKATSNICTNQALIALMATVFMETLRQAGAARTGHAESRESALSGVESEAAASAGLTSMNSWQHRQRHAGRRSTERLLEKKIIGGLPLAKFYPELGNAMLLCATEMTKRADMDALAEAFSMIRKVRSHITQNEDLIFEHSSPGKIGYQLPALDVPDVDPAEALGADNVREEIAGFPGSQRSGSDPPFHAAFHLELRDRSGHVSAGLLHHEVQPAHQ